LRAKLPAVNPAANSVRGNAWDANPQRLLNPHQIGLGKPAARTSTSRVERMTPMSQGGESANQHKFGLALQSIARVNSARFACVLPLRAAVIAEINHIVVGQHSFPRHFMAEGCRPTLINAVIDGPCAG